MQDSNLPIYRWVGTPLAVSPSSARLNISMGVHKLERRWGWIPSWLWGSEVPAVVPVEVPAEVPGTEATSDSGKSEIVTLPMEDAIQPVDNGILDIINTASVPQDKAFVVLIENDAPKTASPLPAGTMERNNIPNLAIPGIFPADQDKKEETAPQILAPNDQTFIVPSAREERIAVQQGHQQLAVSKTPPPTHTVSKPERLLSPHVESGKATSLFQGVVIGAGIVGLGVLGYQIYRSFTTKRDGNAKKTNRKYIAESEEETKARW